MGSGVSEVDVVEAGVAVGEAGTSFTVSGLDVGAWIGVGVRPAAGIPNAGVGGLPPHATSINRNTGREMRQYQR